MSDGIPDVPLFQPPGLEHGTALGPRGTLGPSGSLRQTQPDAGTAAMRTGAEPRPDATKQPRRRTREVPAAESRAIPASERPAADVTDDERDVLDLVVKGATNMEIARALNLSVSTAASRVSSLMLKMKARTRYHLITMAHKARRPAPLDPPPPPSPPEREPEAKPALDPDCKPKGNPKPVSEPPIPEVQAAPADLVSELDVHRMRYGTLDVNARRVFRLVAFGYEDQAMCYALGLPFVAVDRLVHSLIEIFEVSSREELHRVALDLFPALSDLRQAVIERRTSRTPLGARSILWLVGAGYSDAEIARAKAITLSAARREVRALVGEHGVLNRAALVQQAREITQQTPGAYAEHGIDNPERKEIQ